MGEQLPSDANLVQVTGCVGNAVPVNFMGSEPGTPGRSAVYLLQSDVTLVGLLAVRAERCHTIVSDFAYATQGFRFTVTAKSAPSVHGRRSQVANRCSSTSPAAAQWASKSASA